MQKPMIESILTQHGAAISANADMHVTCWCAGCAPELHDHLCEPWCNVCDVDVCDAIVEAVDGGDIDEHEILLNLQAAFGLNAFSMDGLEEVVRDKAYDLAGVWADRR